MGSSSHAKHEKSSKSKDKKEKKEKKEKRRRHDESDSEEERRRVIRRLEKEHKQRQVAPISLDDPEPDNPFGDRRLGEKFFWKKKVEKDVKAGQIAAVTDLSSAAKDRERLLELERVKQRREMNEAEFVKRQEEVSNLEHARLVADAVHEAAKEEQFHLKQAVGRARRRLDEGRAQPVDELIRYLWLQDSHPSSPALEPYSVFEEMRPGELQQLMEDVELLKSLDVEDPTHAAYWNALYFHMKWKLDEEVEAECADREAVREGRVATAVHESVKGEIEAMFAGQSHSELLELEDAVATTLQSSDCVDPEFWVAVQSRLGLAKARTKVREIYRLKVQEALTRRREAGAAEDALEAELARERAAPSKPAEDAADGHAEGDRQGGSAPREGGEESPQAEQGAGAEESGDESDGNAAPPAWLAESDGRFSPPPVAAELVARQDVVHEDEDREQLQLLRLAVQEEERRQRRGLLRPPAAAPSGVHPDLAALTDGAGEDAATAAARRQALRVMGNAAEGELAFGGEVPLESQEYYWQEKYKPRKPMFFNRVHTGYDWNKYNRVHYDVDNPPPKVVQGYKFNIFYPDLIDKKKAPTYRVVDDPQCQDDTMCLLVFEAGPPYEDVAFRIVKKDWEHSHKRGFKNVFERDVLHLYFNFKRNPYRR